MLYVGIDIGKFHHEASIVNEQGKEVKKSLRFSNNREGFQRLISWLPHSAISFAIEATGHYWFTLFDFLTNKNFPIKVVNPIQCDAYRQSKIRKTKTDKRDSFIIADLLRLGLIQETISTQKWILELRDLSRFRFSLIDQISDLKRHLIAILDKIFPEFEDLFKSPFLKSARELLKAHPTPEDIASLSIKELTQLLTQNSHGKFTEEKAEKIKLQAANSVGLTYLKDSATVQIRCLLLHIEFIEEQVKLLEEKITEIVQQHQTFLTTIPGISNVLAGTIIGEIGNIDRFSSPRKLTAYAGIDPTTFSSGEFEATQTHMSKRGSPYLRRALWLAATCAWKFNPDLRDYYNRKIAQGKHYGTVIGAIARKLIYRIYTVVKEQRPYKVS